MQESISKLNETNWKIFEEFMKCPEATNAHKMK